MTERLYYHDAALLEFDATVIEHAGDANHVVLDRTAFYPTSGGQPHDTGRLGASHVTDVTDDDGRIIHRVEPGVPLGPVHGVVDGERRRDHMQQHSAQHLLSALAADRFGWETASVHFGDEHSSIEFAVATASSQQLAILEQIANTIVAEAREVSVGFEDAAAAERIGLRKPSGRTGEIRVITIAGIDRSACGGTHVARTSEIGPVLLLGAEKIRNHQRVSFVAGRRTILHARDSDLRLARVARELSCSVGELDELVPARQREFKVLRDHATRLELEAALARLRQLVATTPRGADGWCRILHRATDETGSMLRAMAQGAGQLDHVIFAAIAPSPPTIFFATSADTGVDAGARLKPALEAVDGRGGGSARVAQGTAPAPARLEEVAAAVLAS